MILKRLFIYWHHSDIQFAIIVRIFACVADCMAHFDLPHYTIAAEARHIPLRWGSALGIGDQLHLVKRGLMSAQVELFGGAAMRRARYERGIGCREVVIAELGRAMRRAVAQSIAKELE